MTARPPPTEAFQAAIATGDERAVALMLTSFPFSVLGRNDVAEPHAAVAVDNDGVRSIIAFTSRDAAAAFGSMLRLLPVPGGNIPGLAQHYMAARVLLDPAGPSPATFDLPHWQLLLDGVAVAEGLSSLQGLTVASWPDVPGSVRLTLAGLKIPDRVLLFARVIDGRHVPTVGVAARQSAEPIAPRVVAALHGIGGFEYLDVVELEPEVADRIAALMPGSVVEPA